MQATFATTLPVTISAAVADIPPPTTTDMPGEVTSAGNVTFGEKLKGQSQPNRTFDLPPLPPPEPTPADGSYALPAVYAHPTAVQQPKAPAAAIQQPQQQQPQQQQQQQQQQPPPQPAAAAPATAFASSSSSSSRPATTLSVVTVTTSQPVTVKISPARKAGLPPLTEVNVAGQTRKVVGGDAGERHQAALHSNSPVTWIQHLLFL
jgi:hypothetical protein